MFKNLQLAIRTAINSFWLLPLGLSVMATLLFAVTYYIDSHNLAGFLADYPPPFSIAPVGARQLLATIAGSLITVASLVFSMTLIALTVAAGNIGARLLLRYMQNRSIQITLGIFLAGFTFALLTLSAIGGDENYVPRVSVFTAITIAVVCFVWLVFAFHDLAKSIQVDQAIAELSTSLCLALKRLNEECELAEEVADELPGEVFDISRVCAQKGGYVVSINRVTLASIADQYKLAVHVKIKLGSFVMPGELLADVSEFEPALLDKMAGEAQPSPEWEALICKTIILSPSRNDLDDPFFCLRLLNEIAARAMSPSLNDIYTAVACVDHVALGVEYILTHGLPNNGFKNSEGQLQIIFSSYYFDEFIYAAFDQIRHSGMASPALMVRLLDRLKRLRGLAISVDQRHTIDQFIARVYSSAQETFTTQVDLLLLEEAYRNAKKRDYY